MSKCSKELCVNLSTLFVHVSECFAIFMGVNIGYLCLFPLFDMEITEDRSEIPCLMVMLMNIAFPELCFVKYICAYPQIVTDGSEEDKSL